MYLLIMRHAYHIWTHVYSYMEQEQKKDYDRPFPLVSLGVTMTPSKKGRILFLEQPNPKKLRRWSQRKKNIKSHSHLWALGWRRRKGKTEEMETLKGHPSFFSSSSATFCTFSSLFCDVPPEKKWKEASSSFPFFFLEKKYLIILYHHRIMMMMCTRPSR